MARDSERTLAQLTDPARRPELPRAPIAREFMEHNPHEQVELCGEVLLKNLVLRAVVQREDLQA